MFAWLLLLHAEWNFFPINLINFNKICSNWWLTDKERINITYISTPQKGYQLIKNFKVSVVLFLYHALYWGEKKTRKTFILTYILFVHRKKWKSFILTFISYFTSICFWPYTLTICLTLESLNVLGVLSMKYQWPLK